jgi:hypothetical protein
MMEGVLGTWLFEGYPELNEECTHKQDLQAVWIQETWCLLLSVVGCMPLLSFPEESQWG